MNVKDLVINFNSFKNLVYEIDNEKFFHAYTFTSNDEILKKEYIKYLSSYLLYKNFDNIKVINNTHPDIYFFPKSGDDFKVSDVSEIIDISNLKPIEAKMKIVVINNFDSSSAISQNKLLKILEEPPKNLQFFLLCNNLSSILPTILSRTVNVNIETLTSIQIKNLLNVKDSEYISSICENNLTNAYKFLEDKNFNKIYSEISNIVLNLNSSKDIVSYLSNLINIKFDIKTVCDLMSNFYVDILNAKCNNTCLILNEKYKQQIINRANDFSVSSIIKILELINETYKKSLSNVNVVSLIEDTIIKILEVKVCK